MADVDKLAAKHHMERGVTYHDISLGQVRAGSAFTLLLVQDFSLSQGKGLCVRRLSPTPRHNVTVVPACAGYFNPCLLSSPP